MADERRVVGGASLGVNKPLMSILGVVAYAFHPL
jgi:hypothetical protein